MKADFILLVRGQPVGSVAELGIETRVTDSKFQVLINISIYFKGIAEFSPMCKASD